MSSFLNQTHQYIPLPQLVPPPPEQQLNLGYFEVEKITGKRTIKGKILYKVHWKGYPPAEATWEPIENLNQAEPEILLFQQNRKSKASKKIDLSDNSKQHQTLTDSIQPNEVKKEQQPTIDSSSAIKDVDKNHKRSKQKIEPIRVLIKENKGTRSRNKNNIPSYQATKSDAYIQGSKKVKTNPQYNLEHRSFAQKPHDTKKQESKQDHQELIINNIVNKPWIDHKIGNKNNAKVDKEQKKLLLTVQNAISEKDQQMNEQLLTPNNATKKPNTSLSSYSSQAVKSIMSILQVKEVKVRQYLVQYQNNNLQLLTSEEILQKHHNEFISYLESKLNHRNKL